VSPVRYELGFYIPEDAIHVALYASHAALPIVISKFFALTQPVNPPTSKKELIKLQ
jgi:hypothetical protein